MKLDRFSKLSFEVVITSTTTFALSRLISLKKGYERYDNVHSLFLSALVGGTITFWHISQALKENQKINDRKIDVWVGVSCITYTALLTLYSYKKSSLISPFIFLPLLGVETYFVSKSRVKLSPEKPKIAKPIKPFSDQKALQKVRRNLKSKSKPKTVQLPPDPIAQKNFDKILFSYMQTEAGFIKDGVTGYKKFTPNQSKGDFIVSVFRLGIYAIIKYKDFELRNNQDAFEKYKRAMQIITDQEISLPMEWKEILTLKLSNEEDQVLNNLTQKLEKKNPFFKEGNFALLNKLFSQINRLTIQIIQDIYNERETYDQWDQIFDQFKFVQK